MKKIITLAVVAIIVLLAFTINSNVQATSENVMSNETEGSLTEIKEAAGNSLESYKQKYGSDVYGLTAYILHLIRIYSIPFCFLGIIISGIHQYIIGIRKLDTQEKGLTLMVTFVTLLVICQILPLAFAIVVKFGRG